MNISSFSTISAIALTGLAFTLGTTSASAHGNSRCSSGGHGSHGSSHGHSSSRGHCSTSHGHGRTCSHLPRGCRSTRYRGERCWYGGGRYYRCAPTGGYICINEAPEVEYTTPVVRRRVVQQVVEQPVIEEEAVEEEVDTSYDSEEAVSYLPAGCETVYVGGVRCWYRNGCYYRHCGRGYTKFHCGGRGHVSRGCHTSSRSCHSSRGRTCSTGRGHSSSHGRSCSTSRGHGSSHGSHGHSSSHGGHSSHGHR